MTIDEAIKHCEEKADNTLGKILADDIKLKKQIATAMDKMISDMSDLYTKIQAKPYTVEYWQRFNDIRAIHFIYECMVEYREKGECTMIRNGLCDLYVLDKIDRTIHRVGEGSHDSLSAYAQDEVHYENMQNGDGGGVRDEEGYGYVIIKTDNGFLCDEFGIIDKRFVPEIKKYLQDNGEDISQFDEQGFYINRKG